MARIYLDARNITNAAAGVARYARSLITEIVDQSPGDEFVIIRHRSNTRPLFADPPPSVQEIPVNYTIDGLQNMMFGHRALQSAFARGGPPDLYHSLFHILPMRTRAVLGDTPVVTTLHDFVWIDHPDASQPSFVKARSIEAFARRAIPFALRTSDRVIAISEPTRRRAREYVDDDKMVTIGHGVDEAFFHSPGPPGSAFTELMEPDRPCIAAIGNHKPYKNLGLLIDAFAHLIDTGFSAQLVLIGDCEKLSNRIGDTTASEWITVTGYVDDEMLRAILSQARIFCLPSKVEGFGLPLLEAMAMGLPTIIANIEPLASIAGEAALRVEPNDIDGLTLLLRRILEDDRLADRLARRGKRRAGQFRWSTTAQRTIEVYRQLLHDDAVVGGSDLHVRDGAGR